jgi:hypothetical protein
MKVRNIFADCRSFTYSACKGFFLFDLFATTQYSSLLKSTTLQLVPSQIMPQKGHPTVSPARLSNMPPQRLHL